MKLYLVNHSYKYAVEQIMLLMFPGERPIYPERPPEDGEDYARISLSYGKARVTASTRLVRGGEIFAGRASAEISKLGGKIVTDRLLQRIIKFSFFRAATACTGEKPPWGALTGIRPGRFMMGLIAETGSEDAAMKALMREYYVTDERAKLCLEAARAGIHLEKQLNKRDICLYVGIPFCPTRCAYCSFVSSSVEKSMSLVEPYMEALSKEIDATATTANALGLRVITVYIGGGTPTTLTSAQLKALIEHIYTAFDTSSLCEFTVEAGRPDTITYEKLETLRSLGDIRISINPQTMDDRVLEIIGRRHTAQDVLNAFSMAKRAGGLKVNADLIAGLPGDNEEEFKKSLDSIIGLQPVNITVHTLSMKKGSRLMVEQTELPSGETVGKMLDYGMEALYTAGYRPYYLYRQKYMSGSFENVGWSLPRAENIYNICIMEELCSILAMGAGGSTKLVNSATGRIKRIINAKYPKEYIERIDKITELKNDISEFYADFDLEQIETREKRR